MIKFEAAIMPDNLNTVPDLARQIEDMGFKTLWTAETSHNPFFPLTLGAYATQNIELGTAIAVAFPRSPMTMAYAAWDLAAQSGGRFILGLGTQVKAHIVRRFSTTWDSPGPRLRDYVLAMRAIWDAWQHNTPLKYEGDFYNHTLMTPFFQPAPIEHPNIPIYIAGVNEYLCRLAGEVCDGFHVHPFHTVDYLREVVTKFVSEGAASTGRSRADVQMTCSIFVATGTTDEEIENQKVLVKSQVAFYASTPTYRAVLEHHGMADLGEKLSVMSREGRWMEMHELISDDFLEKLCVIAPIDELPYKVKERYDGLLDRVAYYMPYDNNPEMAPMWEASLKVLA